MLLAPSLIFPVALSQFNASFAQVFLYFLPLIFVILPFYFPFKWTKGEAFKANKAQNAERAGWLAGRRATEIGAFPRLFSGTNLLEQVPASGT